VLGRMAVSSVQSQTVVPIYQSAGLRWVDAQSLYEPILWQDLYRNPPGFALLFAPTANWHPRAVALVWRILGLVVFLTGLARFTRSPLVFLLAPVLFLPTFNNGQVNGLMLGCALWGVSAMERERWWPAAGCFAFMIGLKVYPVALVGLVCLVAPRTLPWRVLLLTVAVFALPYLFQSPSYVTQQYQDFLNLTNVDDRSAMYLERAPRDWTILPRILFGTIVARDVSLLVSGVAGLGMAVLVWRVRMNKIEAALGFGLIWMTLFGPATETNTYSLLAPMGFVLLRCKNVWETVAAGLGLVLVMATITRCAFPPQWGYPLIWAQPTGAILLLSTLVYKSIQATWGEVAEEKGVPRRVPSWIHRPSRESIPSRS
jgi:hypothetical protein